MALTAAVWSPNLMVGAVECKPQTYSWLSLPPLAISRSSGDHFSPQTCDMHPGHKQEEGFPQPHAAAHSALTHCTGVDGNHIPAQQLLKQQHA